MAHQKQLVIAPGVLDAAARAEYARMLRFDISAGLCSLDDLLGGAQCYDVRHGDVIAGRYALEFLQRGHGVECVVCGAVGRLPGVDLTATVLPVIEQHARLAGARALRVQTRREGLANKLIAMGFGLRGFILQKPLCDD